MFNEVFRLRATLATLSAEEARYALDRIVTILADHEVWSHGTADQIALTIDLAAARKRRAERNGFRRTIGRALVGLGWP